jgi:DNA-binding response OmpR family regulator
MPAQVLLADDDPLLLDLLRRQLSSKRFDVLTAPDGAVALELAEKHRPARRRQEDLLAAFALGAHDYVAKPFRPEDLIARIRRLALHVW